MLNNDVACVFNCSYLFFSFEGKEKFDIEGDVTLYSGENEVDEDVYEAVVQETKVFSIMAQDKELSKLLHPSCSNDETSHPETKNEQDERRKRFIWYSLPSFEPEIQSKLVAIQSLPLSEQQKAGKNAMLDVKFVHSIVNTISGDLAIGLSESEP